jgi:hypothetical protein
MFAVSAISVPWATVHAESNEPKILVIFTDDVGV